MSWLSKLFSKVIVADVEHLPKPPFVIVVEGATAEQMARFAENWKRLQNKEIDFFLIDKRIKFYTLPEDFDKEVQDEQKS